MSAARKGQKGQEPTLNAMRNHASSWDMRTKQIERQVYPRTDDMVKLQNERHAEGCSQGTWQERRMVDVKKKKKKNEKKKNTSPGDGKRTETEREHFARTMSEGCATKGSQWNEATFHGAT